MPAWIRFVLIWLIAITVPLKGLAAVSMIGCGPVHQETAGMAVETAQHVHANVAADAHQSPAESAEAGTGDGPAGIDLGSAAGHLVKMKCGSCSPCCGTAAPAADAVSTLPVQPESTVVPSLDAHCCGVVTDVPHRPPRPAHA